MSARTMKMERHALASQERIGGLWTCTCTCERQFAALVKDDALRDFWAHQDAFDGGRWEQSPVPMITGYDTECVMCGDALYVIGDRDAVCRKCETADPFWNQL